MPASPPTVVRYAVAVAATALATLCSLAADPIIARIPAAFFLAAVALSAWYGGFGPGLVSAILGLLAIDYFIFPPRFAFDFTNPDDPITLGMLGVVAVVIGATNASLRAAQRRAAAAEVAEREQREWLATTLASIGDAVIATDARGTVTFLNPAAQALTGWLSDEAAGRPLSEVFRIVNETTGEPVESPLVRVLRDGVTVGLANHTVLVGRDGRRCPIDDSGAPIRDARGGIIGAVLVFRGIAERRAAEHEREGLLEREQAARVEAEVARVRLATTLESIVDGFCAFDREWRYTYVNARAAEMLGRAPEDLLGTVVWEEYPAAIDSPLYRSAHRAVAEGVPTRVEYLSSVLGRWLEVYAYPSADGVALYFQDVTERVQVEQALRASEARLRRVLDTSLVGIITWDLAGGIEDANDAFLAMLGYDRDDLRTGRLRWDDLTPEEYRGLDAQKVAELVANGMHTPYEKEYLHKDGTRVPVLVGSAFFEGSRDHGVSYVLDISERRALEQMQQQFLASVSHELRNPLSSIRGYAQLMRRREAYSERAVDAIVAQTDQLARLVDDLLDVSRLEAGRLELRPSLVDLVARVRASAEQAQATTERHTICFQAPDGALEGRWDPDRLDQVFRNLLGNAIKYSPDGGEIRVHVERSDGEASVTITDYGLGIAAEQQPRLFDPFYRADGRAGGLPGLGLGLYITRELVEAHGGRIEASSDGDGQGSTFVVRLPLAPVV